MCVSPFLNEIFPRHILLLSPSCILMYLIASPQFSIQSILDIPSTKDFEPVTGIDKIGFDDPNLYKSTVGLGKAMAAILKMQVSFQSKSS